jgi:hypothetical protein
VGFQIGFAAGLAAGVAGVAATGGFQLFFCEKSIERFHCII